MKGYRFATGLAFTIMGVSMLYAHLDGRLFPALPVGALAAVILLVGVGVYDGRNRGHGGLGWYLTPFVVIAVALRLFTFSFPPTLVGVDPPSYAVTITKIIRTETIRILDIFFYSQAPLSFSFPAMYGIATGRLGPQALSLYPILIGVLFPLVVAAITQRVSENGAVKKIIMAVGVASVATVSVNFGFWPIAQSLGVAYWTVLLLLVIIFIETGYKSALFLIIINLIAQVFTHKLPLMMIFAVLLAFALSSRVLSAVGVARANLKTRRANNLVLVGVVGIFLFIQWAYLTNLIQTFVFRFGDLLLTDSVEISPPLVLEEPTAAAPTDPTVRGILLRQGHWLFLLLLGGFAWLVTAYKSASRGEVRLLLVATAISVGLVLVSVVGTVSSQTPPAIRIISFIEVAIIPLIIIGFASGRQTTDGPTPQSESPAGSSYSLRSVVVGVVLLSLFATQLFSPVAVPDYPGDARDYLTAKEVNGKQFGYEYAQQEVHTDWFMTVSGPPNPGLGAQTDRYLPMGPPLLNANVTAQSYESIMYRSDVAYYRTTRGSWRLLWNPEQEIGSTYNRVFANGGAVMFDMPNEPLP